MALGCTYIDEIHIKRYQEMMFCYCCNPVCWEYVKRLDGKYRLFPAQFSNESSNSLGNLSLN